VTGGQINECSEVLALLDTVSIGRHRRPRALLGDKAYSMRALRTWARRHHVRLVVPERADQVVHRRHRAGRKPAFDLATYRRRNIIERAVGWLKQWRRIATRAEKLAITYRAGVCLALAARYAIKHFADRGQPNACHPPICCSDTFNGGCVDVPSRQNCPRNTIKPDDSQ
jgi:transposase